MAGVGRPEANESERSASILAGEVSTPGACRVRRPHDAIFFQPVSVPERVARLTTRYVGAGRPPDAANDPDERQSGSATYPGLLTARTASGTCHLAPGYHGEATALPDGAAE